MAPVEIHRATSLLPAWTLFTHISLVGVFSTIALKVIYQSYLTLPPSSATRYREPLRKGHVRTFSLLTLLSLTTALYYFSTFSGLSYRTWASERGVDLPQSFFGDYGALRGGEHPGRLHVFKWLSDTSFYLDIWEIVIEKARYFWWSQQVSLALIPWSLFLAIEGQRRNIPNLWAFMGLAQLVNLSYAQNLFFIAVLLTPAPLPENGKELTTMHPLGESTWYSRLGNKPPEGWVPKTHLYVAYLLTTYTTVSLFPLVSDTSSFIAVNLLSRLLVFVPLVLPYIVPQAHGTVHEHPHEAYASYFKLFTAVSILSTLLHLEAFTFAIVYNTPDRNYYRQSRILHFPYKKGYRSPFDRGITAFGKLFGALREHPAIGAVGTDVILSGLSLGTWASVRDLDTLDIARSIGLFWSEKEESSNPMIKVEEIETEEPIRRRVGRPRKTDAKRAKKVLPENDADSAYIPSEADHIEEGDEEADDNWEVAAWVWGVITAAGLGVGSAGVYGAEAVAR